MQNKHFNDLTDIIGEDDFYSPVHQLIFQAFKELSDKSSPIDLITVYEQLKKMGKGEEVGGPVYLAEVADSTTGGANTMHHAQIVRETSVRRRLMETATVIIENCFDGSEDVGTMLDEAERAVFKISETRVKSGFSDSNTLVKKVFQQISERVGNKDLLTGVDTGYTDLNELTAGLQPTDLIIIAGRPSMGKTAFALNVAVNAAVSRQETTTAVFSLEMGEEQLLMRMLCTLGRVDLADMRRGYITDQDWNGLYEAADILNKAPIWIDDTPAISTLEVRARCRRLKAEHNLGLVIIDYLQLMRASRRIDSREQEISDISRSLKALAKELHVPVVALSQLNRKVEDRTGSKRPILSDLRESGAIEQDADVIMFVYRDEVYNKNDDNPNKGTAEIIIGKQRNGPLGTVKLFFDKSYTAFRSMSRMAAPSEEE